LTGFSREPGLSRDIRLAYIHRHGFNNGKIVKLALDRLFAKAAVLSS
jgi:hypothetical protein